MKQLLLLPFLFITVLSFGQVPNYVPTNGLVGYWPFNANANDESGNGNDGTVNGATLTTDRFGNTNSAYDFDGNDNIDILEGFDYIARTTNIWVNNSDPNWGLSGTRIAFDNDYSTLLYGLVQVGIADGISDSINFQQGNSSPYRAFAILNNWSMITIVRAMDSINYFYNGDLKRVVSLQNAATTWSSFIGFRVGGRIDNTRYWVGNIDDIGIWNRALDSCEVKDLYNASLGNCCALNPIVSQPTDQSTTIGNNATFSFTDNLTGASYQWQMDAGTGYSDLSNAGQFSGTDTQTLTISTTTMSNNNTLYRCIVTESSNCMDTTDVSTLTVIDNTSINELDNSLVKLFPNPTSDQITIDIKGYSGVVNVEVYDLQGRLLETTTNNVVSLKNHAKGIYVLKVSYGEITEEVRVVRD